MFIFPEKSQYKIFLSYRYFDNPRRGLFKNKTEREQTVKLKQ